MHFVDSGVPDNTKRVVINFYNAEEIVNSKKALWEAADNELIGEYKDRRSSDRRPVNDIVIAIQKLDAINKLPNFVAKDLDRVPNVHSEEMNLLILIQGIAKLEKYCDEYNEMLSKVMIDLINLRDGTRPISADNDIHEAPHDITPEETTANIATDNRNAATQPSEENVENAPTDNNNVINGEANSRPTVSGASTAQNNARTAPIEGVRWGPLRPQSNDRTIIPAVIPQI